MVFERPALEIAHRLGFLSSETVAEHPALNSLPPTQAFDMMVKQGLLSDSQRLECVSDYSGIPFVILREMQLDVDAGLTLPHRIAASCRCLVLEITESAATVAMTNPLDLKALDEVSAALDRDIDPVWASEVEILEKMQTVYGDITDVSGIIASATRDLEGSGVLIEAQEQEEETTTNLEAPTSGDESPIVQLANAIFVKAIRFRASDIHIEPARRSVRVRFRIDGVLKEVMEIPREVHRAVVSRVKILCGMDIAERRMPQDGRCSLSTSEGEFDFRVNTYPSVHGEKVCVRILDKRKAKIELTQLGLEGDPLANLMRSAENSQGFVMISGPTGSGKTTTLYALLNYLNTSERHIITIEDPVEYQVDGIVQASVNKAAGMTFAGGLRAMLRQDPDIILVGECRDPETGSTAIEAALTGHLVLTSIHANDSAAAVTRLIEMGIEPFLVGASMSCSVAQRLLRANCPQCTTTYKPEEALLMRLGLPREQVYYRGAGCEKCAQTGYRGRIGIYEVMPINARLRHMITSGATTQDLYAAALECGMLSLAEDAKTKVLRGLTSVEEVIRVVTLEDAE